MGGLSRYKGSQTRPTSHHPTTNSTGASSQSGATEPKALGAGLTVPHCACESRGDGDLSGSQHEELSS